MGRSRLIFLIVIMLLTGCVQAINTYGVGDINAIPKIDYVAYLYSSGEGERLRAVFLKKPDIEVDIVPYSVQIHTGRATPEEAQKFMERGSYYRNIDYQGVTYKGRLIGYLFTNGYHSFSKESIEIDLFERDGKVYISAREKKRD